MTIKQIQTGNATQLILPARGIYEVCTNVPFLIFVTNFSEKPFVLQKHTSIAMGTSPPECITETESNDGLEPTMET